MGNKVHPKVFRLSTIYGWDSKWFASGKKFVAALSEDVTIRSFLRKQLKEAQVDKIEVERTPKHVTIAIYAAKPGVVIGRAGAGIEELKKKIVKNFYQGRRVTLAINVHEIARPMLSGEVIGQQIAKELESRMAFRRSMKMAIERVMKAGAKGVKLTLSGRLNGAEIARTETLSQGSIPLHNLRADIDFARVRATTLQGVIGIKVWIYRGEVFGGTVAEQKTEEKQARPARDDRRGGRGGQRPYRPQNRA